MIVDVEEDRVHCECETVEGHELFTVRWLDYPITAVFDGVGGIIPDSWRSYRNFLEERCGPIMREEQVIHAR